MKAAVEPSLSFECAPAARGVFRHAECGRPNGLPHFFRFEPYIRVYLMTASSSPALTEGVLPHQQLVDLAGHARHDRGLHLHGLDHEQNLILLDRVALAHQHAGHHRRHGRAGLRLVGSGRPARHGRAGAGACGSGTVTSRRMPLSSNSTVRVPSSLRRPDRGT